MEQLGRVRVGGREVGSRIPTEHVPNPVLKVAFWLIIVVLFVDEFLILVAILGGPIALLVVVGFVATSLIVTRTKRGSRAKRSVKSRVSRSISGREKRGYRTRRKSK